MSSFLEKQIMYDRAQKIYDKFLPGMKITQKDGFYTGTLDATEWISSQTTQAGYGTGSGAWPRGEWGYNVANPPAKVPASVPPFSWKTWRTTGFEHARTDIRARLKSWKPKSSLTSALKKKLAATRNRLRSK